MFALVVVLLAPYAGCHILTSPPIDPVEQVEESSAPRGENRSRQGELEETVAEEGQPKKLDDIQDLLAQ